MSLKHLTVIIPVYNEAEVILQFYHRLCKTLDNLEVLTKIVYVDDGSTDTTLNCLLNIADNDARVSILELSRNFGHQAAISAGLEFSESDYAITLDGDGQHPPELIPEMLRLAEKGYDVSQVRPTNLKIKD